MLEQEIKGLKEEMALLRETIRVLTYAMGNNGEAPKLPSPGVQVELPEPKTDDAVPFPDKEEPIGEAGQPSVTADEVQTLCMTIVRKDRSKKAKVKELIGEFGASLVKDVPAEKLPELKAKLEAL